MAKVSDVIFCLRAVNIDGEGTCAQGILTTLTPEYIPGLFSFAVVITLLDIEYSDNHQLIVDFVGPESEKVVHVSTPIPMIPVNNNLPPEYHGINIAMEWNNVNLKLSGEYTVKVFLDNNLLKEKRIFVKGKNEL